MHITDKISLIFFFCFIFCCSLFKMSKIKFLTWNLQKGPAKRMMSFAALAYCRWCKSSPCGPKKKHSIFPVLMSKVDDVPTLESKSRKNARFPFIPNDDLDAIENTITACVYLVEAASTQASLREDDHTKKPNNFQGDPPFSTSVSGSPFRLNLFWSIVFVNLARLMENDSDKNPPKSEKGGLFRHSNCRAKNISCLYDPKLRDPLIPTRN